MAVRKIRRISFDGHVFFWRVSHRHAKDGTDCRDVFTAFAETQPRRPLRIFFPWSESHGPGFPHQKAIVHDFRTPALTINLNRPEVARRLIELAVRTGWNPAVSTHPYEIANGFDLFVEGVRRADGHRETVDIHSVRGGKSLFASDNGS